MKKREEWKKYIKMAKSRINGDRNDNEIIFVNDEALSSDELLKWNQIISEIVASDVFVCNPIGQMIDHNKYEKMTEANKNKYIMDLSEIYLKIRKNIKR